MADTTDLKSVGINSRAGSSPAAPTINERIKIALDTADWGIVEDLFKELLYHNPANKWNIDELTFSTIYVCKGNHEKYAPCVWETYKRVETS